jgi:glutamine synthetase
VVEAFEKYAVLSQRELESRQEIYLEQYCKTINTEAILTGRIAKTSIYPAAVRYLSELAGAAANLKSAGLAPDTTTLDKVTGLLRSLEANVAALEKTLDHHGADSTLAEAKHFANDVLPAMLAVRGVADELEALVADDLWPLPTYQEMLFIK